MTRGGESAVPRPQERSGPGASPYPRELLPRLSVPPPREPDRATLAMRTVAPEAPAGPGYEIPEMPEAAWVMAASGRRVWLGRGVLLVIMTIQAALSLRLTNTAFQDEALYLAAGHAELSHLLHGTPLPKDYAAYFSGSPQLYPVLAALVDGVYGLAGARLMSLVLMLCTTGLLYAITRRLFNERTALGAAGLFAVVQSTVVMGHYATYDAMALFLLACATWIVVRTDRLPAVAVLLAAPVAVLAVGVKYASALYLMTIVGLALLTAWPRRGAGSAILRAVLLVVGIGVLLAAGAYRTDLLDGVRQTTTDRVHGSDGAGRLLEQSAEWGGLMFITAVGGAVSYVCRSRMNESPLARRLGDPGRSWRVLLGLLLCGTAVLAPAYQIHLATVVSLYKHIGFGLFFAAPMAGVGLTRLVGAHFRYPQLGIMVWSAVLCLGIQQAEWRFGLWPDSTRMIRTISPYVNSEGHYLSSTPEVPVYYLRAQSSHRQWQSVFGMEYTDAKGTYHAGDEAYRSAVRDGEFDLIVLDGLTNPRVDDIVATAVAGNAHYRLLGRLPFANSGGTGAYRIWVKVA
ncbi:ArnT family glycosyltransferase [Streptomyces sp. NPDC049813]|uniref:ArnT family glycosyltransferase n=1 Tax=Streptomyces sp. NPDC049813 TaxID=3365597 RepID=UPI0037A0DD9B